tara:strand:+ start:648 stop:1160 length:513 start_codon:yes stop_codon:yes gene_type:complete
MQGLLNYAMPTMGEAGGGGAAMEVPEGLGPEAIQMFHNPSAINWMNYTESYPEYPGFNYYGAEDYDPLMQGLSDQGYGSPWDFTDWEDVGRFGSHLADKVTGSFPTRNKRTGQLETPQYNIQDIVEQIQYNKNFESGMPYEQDYQTAQTHPWNFPSQGHVAQDILQNRGF